MCKARKGMILCNSRSQSVSGTSAGRPSSQKKNIHHHSISLLLCIKFWGDWEPVGCCGKGGTPTVSICDFVCVCDFQNQMFFWSLWVGIDAISNVTNCDIRHNSAKRWSLALPQHCTPQFLWSKGRLLLLDQYRNDSRRHKNNKWNGWSTKKISLKKCQKGIQW